METYAKIVHDLKQCRQYFEAEFEKSSKRVVTLQEERQNLELQMTGVLIENAGLRKEVALMREIVGNALQYAIASNRKPDATDDVFNDDMQGSHDVTRS